MKGVIVYMRKAGILLPVTALPSKYGIGCFSKEAYDFIDRLCEAGQSYWQVLPLGHTSYGDSPYQSFSSFAGNPYMISLEELTDEGILSEKECENADFGKIKDCIDYEKIYYSRYPLLKKAYERSDIQSDSNYRRFEDENSDWLEDYALFMSIKEHFNQKPLDAWEEDIRKKSPEAVAEYKEKLFSEIGFWKFVQYKFFYQYGKLKEYAKKNGIGIIGDIPIYTAADSADVWANPKLFQLDEDLRPEYVAGCPPDGFSAEGQLWGNPLYKWEEHKSDDFKWWKKRLKHSFDMYDVLRIDHFRGFDEYYSIKYGSKNAVKGEWKKGPGIELFNAVEGSIGKKEVIAEDLGYITDSVRKLVTDTGYCGMKVLEFAFDSRDTGAANDYLPHNYINNCVVYTGTHDNQTLVSWFDTISPEEKITVRNYLCDYYTPDEKIYMPIICLAMQSPANLCVIPMQDWLGLDDKARINIPSTIGKNWCWRLKDNEFSKDIANEIKRITKRYSR